MLSNSLRNGSRRIARQQQQQHMRALTTGGYIEETVIPTFHFQDSLPKLAVPKLEDTLKSYDYFASPLVSEDEMKVTRAAIADFASGPGPELQKMLEARDKATYSSFISEPWFNMYLEGRDALMINVNPQLTFKDDPNPAKMDQISRAASLIHSSVAFYRTLRDGKLKPDIFHTQPKKSETSWFENTIKFVPRSISFYGAYAVGAYPLDMSQYDRLFSSTRIPLKGKDELRSFAEKESRHITVQYGNGFFPITVLNEDGTSKSREEIQAGLRAITSQPADHTEGESVGVLTSMERDSWAAARAEIEQSDGTKANVQSLTAIDSAMFAVCLEEAAPTDEVELSKTMLHGDATNRWFDKSFQLIVTGNGKASVNFEHAWGDGVAVLRYFNEIYKESITQDVVEDGKAQMPGYRLPFHLSPAAKQVISKAKADAKVFQDSIDLKMLKTDAISKDIVKDLKLGGDGFLQMAFQLAHEKMHGYTPATYESASTAAFKHGRTETIRSATPEAAAFAKDFSGWEVNTETKGALMRAAIKKHGDITKDALMGKGMDRHLYALRDLAARRGDAPAALFEDNTYAVLNKIVLSTSTLSSDALDAGGFGPVSDMCYGIAYGMKKDGAGFGVSSYGRDSEVFLKHLDESLKEMVQVAKQTQK